VLGEFPDDEPLARWIRRAGERIAYQGLPARICWLGTASARVSAYRETESMRGLRRDRRLAAAERARQHRRRRDLGLDPRRRRGGIGRSLHAGMVCLADGTELAAQKLERGLTTDPGTGVMRHVDA
jgi:urocanate hydratase